MNENLSVQNLRKSFSDGFFRRREVLHDVSFTVPKNAITGFVGANGSGKTTTIKCLLHFIFPDSNGKASINFFGKGDLNQEIKLNLGYLPERPYLPEHLTAEEFLQLHWKLSQAPGNLDFNERCDAVLKRVDLQGVRKRYLRAFSKGMLQRIGLAQAILREPKFLILDEPMSGLDPDGRWLVKQIIKEEHQRGATIFFSSHLLADMDELCSHLVVIDLGQILFNGSTADFVSTGISMSRNIEEAFAKRLRERRQKT